MEDMTRQIKIDLPESFRQVLDELRSYTVIPAISDNELIKIWLYAVCRQCIVRSPNGLTFNEELVKIQGTGFTEAIQRFSEDYEEFQKEGLQPIKLRHDLSSVDDE